MPTNDPPDHLWPKEPCGPMMIMKYLNHEVLCGSSWFAWWSNLVIWGDQTRTKMNDRTWGLHLFHAEHQSWLETDSCSVLNWCPPLRDLTTSCHCLNLKLWETSHMLSEVMKVVMSSSPRPYKRRAWIGCTYPVYSTDDFNYQLIMKLAIITTSSFQDSFHSRKMSCSRRHVQRRRSISGGKH